MTLMIMYLPFGIDQRISVSAGKLFLSMSKVGARVNTKVFDLSNYFLLNKTAP